MSMQDSIDSDLLTEDEREAVEWLRHGMKRGCCSIELTPSFQILIDAFDRIAPKPGGEG